MSASWICEFLMIFFLSLFFSSKSARSRVTAASNFHMEKVVTTIKQFFRDWSEEGAPERQMCYKPILDEIQALFPEERW